MPYLYSYLLCTSSCSLSIGKEENVMFFAHFAQYFTLGRGARQGDPILGFLIYFSFRDITYSYKIET